MYGAVLASFAVLLQAATAEQRRSANLLEQEVAERTRTEERLREQERQLVEAQALARVGSWNWDIASDVVTWSDQLYRNFGLEPRAVPLTYRSFLDRVHPEDRPWVEEAITRAYQSGAPFAFDHRLVRTDGTVAWHRSTGEVVREEGQPIRMYGTGQDVTEQKRAEEALATAYEREKEASDRLRALDAMKNTFLSAVSHDLRTPLTGLLGFARLARAKVAVLSRQDLEEFLDVMVSSGERLERMLLDLLDLDRLARGVLEPRRVPTDVGALVRRVAQGVDLAPRPVHLDTAPVVATLDPSQVERIVENLLVNAIRYTPANCPLWIGCRLEGDDVVIAVEDAGPGVPDHLKEAIFEPFRQGDGAHTSGSGIGLSLVSRFAHLHGGDAQVRDRPGGGAAFVVRLPTSDVETASETARAPVR
jgi:PAS domain S-box-containing protein